MEGGGHGGRGVGEDQGAVYEEDERVQWKMETGGEGSAGNQAKPGQVQQLCEGEAGEGGGRAVPGQT